MIPSRAMGLRLAAIAAVCLSARVATAGPPLVGVAVDGAPSPAYVDALSIAQVRALREVRMNQDEMAEEKKAEYMSLILSTVTGVSAGLQNTG